MCQVQSYDVHSTILSLHVRQLRPKKEFKIYPRSHNLLADQGLPNFKLRAPSTT